MSRPTTQEVFELVADRYGTTVEAILVGTRGAELAEALKLAHDYADASERCLAEFTGASRRAVRAMIETAHVNRDLEEIIGERWSAGVDMDGPPAEDYPSEIADINAAARERLSADQP